MQPAQRSVIRPERVCNSAIVGGDFFTDPLRPADVYVLAQILHDWNDERAGAILRNSRRAIPDGGRLLVIDGVVPPGSEPGFLKHMDLHMLGLVLRLL